MDVYFGYINRVFLVGIATTTKSLISNKLGCIKNEIQSESIDIIDLK
jgi:hypothetical protein